jgi:hypothetical protein
MDPTAIVVEWGVRRRKKRKEEINFFHVQGTDSESFAEPRI